MKGHIPNPTPNPKSSCPSLRPQSKSPIPQPLSPPTKPTPIPNPNPQAQPQSPSPTPIPDPQSPTPIPKPQSKCPSTRPPTPTNLDIWAPVVDARPGDGNFDVHLGSFPGDGLIVSVRCGGGMGFLKAPTEPFRGMAGGRR